MSRTWTKKDGSRVRISQMEDSHIENVLKMFRPGVDFSQWTRRRREEEIEDIQSDRDCAEDDALWEACHDYYGSD